MLAVEDHGVLRWLEKLKSYLNQTNYNKYYKFHRQHAHDTTGCVNLKRRSSPLTIGNT